MGALHIRRHKSVVYKQLENPVDVWNMFELYGDVQENMFPILKKTSLYQAQSILYRQFLQVFYFTGKYGFLNTHIKHFDIYIYTTN